MSLRQATDAGAFNPPPFVHARRRVPPETVGRWILETEALGTLAMVEAELFVSHFNVLHILVSECQAPEGWRGDFGKQALAFIVSGLAIITKADVVRLIPLSKELGEQLSGLGWGACQDILAFPADAVAHSVLRLKTFSIDPHLWWETELGKSAHGSLAYLEKRIKFEEDKEKPASRPRAGFLGAFSRLLRWN